MHSLERFFTRLTDGPLPWGPFAFLRPELDEPFRSSRALVLSILHGLFLGMAINAGIALAGRGQTNGLWAPVVAMGTFFIVIRFMLAVAWNARAARVREARFLSSLWLQEVELGRTPSRPLSHPGEEQDESMGA